MEASIIFFDS